MNDKRILFIYPKIKNRPSLKTYAPMAFMYIATCLENNNYITELVDARIADYDYKILKEKLGKKPLYAGITAMSGFQVKDGMVIAEFIKRFDCNIPVVWGGLHGSLIPEDILANCCVDVVAIGEGEKIAVDLADYFSGKSKNSLDEIANIAYRKGEKIFFTKKKDFATLTQQPMPAWHFIKDNIDNYVIDGSIDMLTSRGCPHKCRFCYNESYHKRTWRGRTPEDVLKEVDWVASNMKILIKKINFIDDNFFTDRKRALDICRGVGRKHLTMHVDIRCDYVSKSLIDEIYSYGVNDFYFGIESGSQKVLDLMHKGISVQNIKNTIDIMKQYDIKSVFSFLIGYPGEEPTDLRETLSIARDIYRNIRGASILMNIFTIYPGTYFYYQFKESLKSCDADSYNWETARNKFWLNNKTYLESICTLFRLLNLSPDIIYFGKLKRVIRQTLHVMSKFRVRHGFFNFLLEFRIANYFIQHRSQSAILTP